MGLIIAQMQELYELPGDKKNFREKQGKKSRNRKKNRKILMPKILFRSKYLQHGKMEHKRAGISLSF